VTLYTGETEDRKQRIVLQESKSTGFVPTKYSKVTAYGKVQEEMKPN